MSFETGYEAELSAQALTCDGWAADFGGRATGELEYKLLFDERKAYRELAEPHGSEHVYRGKASGWVRYLVLSDPLRAGDDTRRAVVDRALDLLLHDLTRDEELATPGPP